MNTLKLFENLVSIKEEAIKKMEEMIHPGLLDIIEETEDAVIVRKITMSSALTSSDLEDCDSVIEFHLTFQIEDITAKQIEELSSCGKIIITDCHVNGSRVEKGLWNIQYNTSYSFEFNTDDETVLAGSFGHGSD